MLFLAGAPALGAGLGNDSAFTMTLAAGAGVNEAAKQGLLGTSYLPGAVTVGTLARLTAGLAAEAMA